MKRWTENDDYLMRARDRCGRAFRDAAAPDLIGEGLRIHAERKAVADALRNDTNILALARSMLAYDLETDTGHIQQAGTFRHLTEQESLRYAAVVAGKADECVSNLGAKERRAVLARN